MRLHPTSRQLDYLRSLGVPSEQLRPPAGLDDAFTPHAGGTSIFKRLLRPWRLWAWGVFLLIALACARAAGEPPRSNGAGHESPPTDEVGEQSFLARLFQRQLATVADLMRATKQSDEQLQNRFKNLERRLEAAERSVHEGRQENRQSFEVLTQSMRARAQDVQKTLTLNAQKSASHTAALQSRLDHQFQDIRSASAELSSILQSQTRQSKAADAKLSSLNQQQGELANTLADLDLQTEQIARRWDQYQLQREERNGVIDEHQATITHQVHRIEAAQLATRQQFSGLRKNVLLAFAVCLAALVVLSVLLWQPGRRAEQSLRPANSPSHCPPPPPPIARGGSTCGFKPDWAELAPVDGKTMFDRLVAWSGASLRGLPQAAEPASLACASARGNVRARNEDYSFALRFAGHDILVVADGCGGHAGGREASAIASLSAVQSVLTHLDQQETFAPRALSKVFASAAAAIAAECGRLQIDRQQGLRTTLIVVVASPERYVWGFIGDGAGLVRRGDGSTVHFVSPHKDPDALNLLHASLGPSMAGRPEAGTLERQAGDLLIVTTDGVADFVDWESFPDDVHHYASPAAGDLQTTAEAIVEDLGAMRDEAERYVFTDNLTLALLRTDQSQLAAADADPLQLTV